MDFVSGVVGGIAGGVAKAAGGVLKLVVSQVDGVLGQFNQSKDMLNDLVYTPIQGMMQEVEDGSIWTGPGANAFTQDLKNSFLPQADSMFGGIGEMIKWLTESSTSIQRADDEAVKEVDSLDDFIKSIY